MSKLTAEYLRQWKIRNPEKVADGHKQYRAAHPETGRKASLKYKQKNIEQVRAKQRESRRERWKNDPDWASKTTKANAARRIKRLEIAAGRPRPLHCELCSQNPSLCENKKTVVFDHCHKSGEFRGWICDRCNKVLGLVRDNPVILLDMVRYLEERGNGKIDSTEEKYDPFLRIRRAA